MSGCQDVKITFKQNIISIFSSVRLKLLLSVNCEALCTKQQSEHMNLHAALLKLQNILRVKILLRYVK